MKTLPGLLPAAGLLSPPATASGFATDTVVKPVIEPRPSAGAGLADPLFIVVFTSQPS